MKIKKTMGTVVSGKDRKGYMIHTECGERFLAEPVGSQRYSCNGLHYKSLRAVKDSIIKGALAETDDEPEEELSTSDGADTWDCAYPCALIVSLVDFQQLKSETPHHYDTVIKTLDSYGWLDCAGRPDIARAEREIARVQKLSEKS
jgi:hypothetical protein